MVDARDGLRREIEAKGLKLNFVGEKAGLTAQQMTDIIKKRRKMDANEMFTLCKVIGVTPMDLIEANTSETY